MFSSNVAAHPSVAALRNPRRRQRSNADESVKPPKAKRQRSTLRQDDREPAVVKHLGEGQSLQDDENGPEEISSRPVTVSELALRGPRKQEKRGDLTDGTITLSSNDFYTVSHLPSLPEQIKENPTAPLRYTISSSNGYCLALSQHEAIVWPYTIPPQSLTPSTVLQFAIPCPARHSDDPLPLGTLISKSAEGNPGLMVVVPSTGKITLWETVSNAAILGLMKQRQNGIQGHIPGMLSGEMATEIINAEPSGIIIALSTGRLAHVSIRDSQGKPGISVQLLHGISRGSNVGFFGGIRSVLSGSSWKRKIAAAKAGMSSQRGQRDIIIATSAGEFELWDIHWNNGNSLKTQVDAKQSILQALRRTVDVSEDDAQNTFQVYDFAFANGDPNHYAPGDLNDVDCTISLWALVGVCQNSSLSYFVVGLRIVGSTATADVVNPLQLRNNAVDSGALWTPLLCVPKPGGWAFVIFDRGLVIISLVPLVDPVSAQLLEESHVMDSNFQDYIRLKDGNGYAVQGCSPEDSDADHKYPSCILMIRNFGLIRVSALPRQPSNIADGAKITAKSRLEQIVFYGSMKSNPLEFVGYDELRSTPAELEQAALQISDEILRSNSKFIPTTIPSLEQYMKMRASALHDLALYIQRFHVYFSPLARWKLLWGAEKMAAQRAIWKVQQGNEEHPTSNRTHLDFIISKMGDNHKTKIEPGSGETDIVRHWFIHDTWRMEYIIPWILNGLRKEDSNTSRAVDRQFAERVCEACDLSLAALETAFQFREDSAALYGVGEGFMDDDAAIVAQYSALPEFWTSTQINYSETEQLLDLELNICRRRPATTAATGSDSSTTRTSKVLDTIKENIPRQFRAFALLHKERTMWCAAQNDSEIQSSGKMLEKSHVENRKPQLFKLAAIGLLEDAITLAESFRDMDALVELMVDLHEQIKEQRPPRRSEDDSPVLDEGTKVWKRRIDNYFERFGDAWADAFFIRHITVGQPETLFIMQEYQGAVTKFLRSHPAYSKLSWINDIVGERDYKTACTTLQRLAIEQETDIWSKRVEISLAKLAKLAEFEKAGSAPANLHDAVRPFDQLMETCNIQELIYEHVLPTLHGAIDEGAALQLATEQFGNNVVRGKPALRALLQRCLAKLVTRSPMEPEELINLLTLMDPVRFLEGGEEEDSIGGHEFFFALTVLKMGNFHHQDQQAHEYRDGLERLIWRRCMIRDNWEAINRTEKKGDREVESKVHATALAETMRQLAEVLGEDVRLTRQSYTPSRILESNIFPSMSHAGMPPDQQISYLQELDAEADLLRTYVEKGKLDEWFSWIISETTGRFSTPVREGNNNPGGH
ncbi:nuclear pore complex subunit Nup133 [Histoplasma capsulatum var. duboisii H88]|uniref:Nuclear pore complex subunit Nup133 n=2 Tax=Ajellomyces capsulatus TaxID=5037 RepID=F0US63_AJEC8|nr:nuclear pore complex subunit Nup133 [Histoplasma capsulatum H143]EGC48740.1 nuclear pore complex subunit Nup133 [Histoplasma capsulatum var. duboisii H88]QSS54333.1 nuclear pore complex subunit Nup133 [Histoplasma capsulatum var. duboisii H88]